MMTDLLILIREVTRAYPSEWAALIPAVEYVLWKAPKGAHGFSAHDFDRAYSLATSVDVALQPFLVPSGIPETDTMARAFTAWSDLYGMVQRITREKAELRMKEENMSRTHRNFEQGEIVFIRNPKGSRTPKHLLNQPCNGPYEVVSQPTTTSLVLRDPETQVLVRGGALIPLDQVVTGPRRARLALEGKEALDSGERPVSGMICGDDRVGGPPTSAGYMAGQRKGWAQLAPGTFVAYQTYHNGPKAKSLTVGKVIANSRPDKSVTVQPHEGYWTGVRVAHRALYQCDHPRTTVESPLIARDTILYAALKQQVELLTGGELQHSSARRLSDGGWGLLIDETEAIHLLEQVRSRRTNLTSENRLEFTLQAKAEGTAAEGESIATLIDDLGERQVEDPEQVSAPQRRQLLNKGKLEQLAAEMPSLLDASSGVPAGGGYTDSEAVSKGSALERHYNLAQSATQLLEKGHRVALMEVYHLELFYCQHQGGLGFATPVVSHTFKTPSRLAVRDGIVQSPGIGNCWQQS